MSAAGVEITGTLNSDGVLTLDGKPPLPAGRVRVTLQPIDVDLTKTEIWQFFETMWARRKAAGLQRSDAEIDADIAEREREAEEYERWLEESRADPGCPSLEASRMATIKLKPEEALVLIDFLIRFRDKEQLLIAHPAEQNVLWDLCPLLESQVPELVDPAYAQKLEDARAAVASIDWE